MNAMFLSIGQNLKLVTVLSVAVIFAVSAVSSVAATTIVDFSGGTADYNPDQTSGKFWRADAGAPSQVRIQNDGSDYYLRTGGQPTLYYTENLETSDYTLFSLGVGQSISLAVDIKWFPETVNGGLRFGVYSPSAAGTNKGIAGAFQFNDSTNAYSLGWNYYTDIAGGIATAPAANLDGFATISPALSAGQLYRLEMVYTNNGTSGTFVYNVYSLAGETPALLKTRVGTLDYSEAGLDLDPNAFALKLRFNNLNNDGSAITRFEFNVIPEPSSAAMLGLGTALVFGRYLLKGKQKSNQE